MWPFNLLTYEVCTLFLPLSHEPLEPHDLVKFEFELVTHKGFHENTCILVGLRTSKEADALKDKEATGLDNVMEFVMVELPVSIVCEILSTFNKGNAPAARRGNSSEDAVYLTSV